MVILWKGFCSWVRVRTGGIILYVFGGFCMNVVPCLRLPLILTVEWEITWFVYI